MQARSLESPLTELREKCSRVPDKSSPEMAILQPIIEVLDAEIAERRARRA